MSETERDQQQTDERHSALSGLPADQVSRLEQLWTDMPEGTENKAYPSRELLSLLGDKWSALILMILSKGSLRHAQLKRLVTAFRKGGSISQFVLTEKLRAFERNGMLSRHVTDDVPPSVSYELTDMGQELVERMFEFFYWVADNRNQIESARRQFQEKSAD